MFKFEYKGVLAAVAGLLLFGCSQQERQVSYKADVGPILEKYCLECHKPGGEGTEKSGLDMSSYENLMKGTKFGPVVNPGNSLTSALNMLVEGRADRSIKMPHGRDSLPADKIATLKNWVQQGAKNN